MAATLFNPTTQLQLPWYVSKDDERFQKLLAASILLAIILAVWIASLPPPKEDRAKAAKVPEAIAKLVIEQKKEAKKVEPPKQPVPLPTTPQPVAKQPEPTPVAPQPETPKVVAAPTTTSKASTSKPTQAQIDQAREVAKSSGVLAMKDDLAAMRNSFAAFSGGGGGGKGGAIKTLSNTGATGAGVNRTMIVGSSSGTSGGVQVASAGASSGMGLGVGGGSGGGSGSGKGPGHGATNVDSVTLGGKVVDTGGDVGKAVESARSSGSRSEESVRAILDQNKAALYAIYNRALREDPALQGRVTFKLVIEPDGSVSSCTIVSSALNNSGLESKLVSRIRLINFGAAAVSSTTTNWVMDFLPY